jgi:hypothetical protein
VSRRGAMSARGVTPEICTTVLNVCMAVPSSQHDVDPTTGRLMTHENAGYMVAGA